MGAARAAFARHCELWNESDRSGWLALFADDVALDDPVGVATKHGRASLETTWDVSNRPGRRWQLSPRRTIECADEVVVDLLNVGTIEGATVEIESIEIWKVNAAGLVVSVRTFFEPDASVHDPYYVPI